MTDKDPTKSSLPVDTAASHESDSSRRFTYDPSNLPTLTGEAIERMYEEAWDIPDASEADKMAALYEKLSDAGVDLSQVQDGSLVIHYLDEKEGTDEVRAIDVSVHENFGTRIRGAELVAAEGASQVEVADQADTSSHERSNELLEALEAKTEVLAENMRDQVEESMKDSHIIDRFLDMVDSLVARLKSGNIAISQDTLGRLIDEAEMARAIANREDVSARENKTELVQLHDAVETVRGLRTAEGVVMSQRTVSSSEMIAMNRANNETVTSEAKRRIDDIVRTLDEFQYSRGHGYEEYAQRLHNNLNAVRPALEQHRALDRLLVSEQNGLAELSRLLRDEKL